MLSLVLSWSVTLRAQTGLWLWPRLKMYLLAVKIFLYPEHLTLMLSHCCHTHAHKTFTAPLSLLLTQALSVHHDSGRLSAHARSMITTYLLQVV